MEEKGGLVSARPQKILPLHTTHSPNFLGLYQNLGLWRNSNYGKGVIVGVLDTGISPDHPSFSDEGMPPPPAKWKGKCEFNGTECNNKLIGARTFQSFEHPLKPVGPIDDVGHGTHTASTAAGSFVSAANVFGNANGTAVGMAPLAHLAIYKVCSDFGCSESDILAAMDTAVEEGVDVLSLSLGGRSAPFTADGIAVGAFGAIQNGVFVSCSAGNSGPATTFHPKLLASCLSRQRWKPIISSMCTGSLENFDVKGKIVLCDRGGLVGRVEKGQVVKDAGGIGMILANEEFDGYSTLADAHVLPASHVSYTDGSFSSRGPSLASPGILKPDIIGPGVSILAAWPVSVENKTNTKATFNMISGTSMSCPHLSGIAALLKSAHPDWSPAAIKSAIMTTGDLVNLGGQPIVDERLLPADILATGAGHVNPSRASDPGLVYDIQPDDYIPYLCGLGYTDRYITYLAQRKVKCSEVQSIPEAQLNYPSFSIMFGPKTQTYTRTITNVGPATSSYTVSVAPPPGVDIKIMPSKIVFTKAKEKATYAVTFTKTSNENNGAFVQGH
ncbi:hypothetical protein GH714_029163 [Hevea brasiliensis]|uniref:Uncharacterized protein n=1 Tax=Hevea brasiliensis TaxID=3981 RepID=A0A6A6LEC7_HEVBR|nr:hypothetical protein GH714_029163 [Hevea brasiliensis]